jgi:outer membrane protein assembly factor BamA
LRAGIHFKGGDLYNESKAKESYLHLTGNRVFQIAEISYQPVKGDTTNRLDAFINLQPFLKRTFSVELEGTNTAGNYGISGAVTLANRNIFKGGEILDFTFRGGLEAQVNLNSNEPFNTREIGTEIGLNFPRFFLFNGISRRLPKRMEPRSRIFTSFNYQTRVEFERAILTLGLLYTWRESRSKQHQINLLDVNYVRLPRIDNDYFNSLEFKTGFQDNLIMAIRYTFLYSDIALAKSTRTSNYFKGSIEPAGNLFGAFSNSGTFEQDEETDQYLVLGVPFAQYIKLDADFRHYFNPTEDHQFVMRFYAGATINYGNSPFLPPFEKSYLAGGSNDLRGWVAYRLGPGNFPNYLYVQGDQSYAAVAPLKLLGSAEYRFPIIKSFRGALFFDAGNIWLWDRNYNTEGLSDVELALVEFGIFRFDTFYKQIALNTGIGWRYDFGFFALRLDMGIKIWDPTEPENQRFVLGGLKWSTINYNIALGYPF